MASNALEREPLRLSGVEERVLELYDRLQGFRLEIALLRARQTHASSSPTSLGLDDVQMSLLEARAALSLREGVLESAMTVQPILRAVHNGTLASPVERGILHYAEIRDGTAVKMAAQCLSSREADDSLSEWELKGVETQRSNAKLALDVVRLAHAAQTHSTQLVDDEALQQEIVRVKDGLKVSRQRWKVIKGTVSAVVAGSGIDWARDERLRNMVLDPIE